MTAISSHPFYAIWSAMIQRCKSPYNPSYHNYGGRGISVCHEWHDAATFLEWLEDHGYGKGLDIDRMDNNGNYCPDNCHVVTRSENCRNNRRNRRFVVYGEELLLCEISEKYDVNPDTFIYRVTVQKRSCEDALIRKGKIDIRTERRNGRL